MYHFLSDLCGCLRSPQHLKKKKKRKPNQKPHPPPLRQLRGACMVSRNPLSRTQCRTQRRQTWVSFYGVCIQVLRPKDQLVFLAMGVQNAPHLSHRTLVLLRSSVQARHFQRALSQDLNVQVISVNTSVYSINGNTR